MEDERKLPARRAALEDLQQHWGTRYLVSVNALLGDDDDQWTAVRLDGSGDVISAQSPGELRAAIRRDYGDRPVVIRER